MLGIRSVSMTRGKRWKSTGWPRRCESSVRNGQAVLRGISRVSLDC